MKIDEAVTCLDVTQGVSAEHHQMSGNLDQGGTHAVSVAKDLLSQTCRRERGTHVYISTPKDDSTRAHVRHLAKSKINIARMVIRATALGFRCTLMLAHTRSTLTGGIETVEKLAAADGLSTGLSLLTDSS